MSHLSCQNCARRARTTDESRFIFSLGPRDDTGLDRYHLYCRGCQMVTVFVPAGCLGMLLFRSHVAISVIDPQAIFAEAQRRGEPERFAIFSPRLQAAMREDGLIPREPDQPPDGAK